MARALRDAPPAAVRANRRSRWWTARPYAAGRFHSTRVRRSPHPEALATCTAIDRMPVVRRHDLRKRKAFGSAIARTHLPLRAAPPANGPAKPDPVWPAGNLTECARPPRAIGNGRLILSARSESHRRSAALPALREAP